MRLIFNDIRLQQQIPTTAMNNDVKKIGTFVFALRLPAPPNDTNHKNQTNEGNSNRRLDFIL
jgi:hypothetical protein